MTKIGWVVLFLCLYSAAASGQALIIPHIVDGGVWQTAIVVTNTTANTAHLGFSFFMETSGNATQPWNLTFLEGTSTQSMTIPAGSTIFLHTPGTGTTTTQGWGQLITDSGIVAYAIFTSRAPGAPAQQGTGAAGTPANRILVPFDNTSGIVAAIAIVNATSLPETISASFRTSEGTVSRGTLNIPANGHMAFVLQLQFAATAGQSGLAEFYTNIGTISAVALSFNVSGAFSSAPIYFESGPPIITGGSGPTWTRKFPTADPGFRGFAAMAYDEGRHEVLLFGGQTSDFSNPNDTWVWDGSNWTRKLPNTSPIGRMAPAMVYDKARGQIVMFGGWNFSGQVLNDTWVWDGSNWTQKFPATKPSIRAWAAMTYDAARQQTVLFGGSPVDVSLPLMNDTWVWDGSNWTQKFPTTVPAPRAFASMIFDPLRSQAVLFGGRIGVFQNYQATNETWLWDGTTWLQASPATSPYPRESPGMAWDGVAGQALLFGGINSPDAYNDSWQWNGVNWTLLSPAISPYLKFGHAMTYDSGYQRVVLYGGNCCGPGNDTWLWPQP